MCFYLGFATDLQMVENIVAQAFTSLCDDIHIVVIFFAFDLSWVIIMIRNVKKNFINPSRENYDVNVNDLRYKVYGV